MGHDKQSPPVVLVTGSTRGIGKSIAHHLSSIGVRVILTFVRNENKAVKTLKELKDKGFECDLVRSDVSNFEHGLSLMEYIQKKYGCLDGLVNNAGGTHDGAFLYMKEDEYQWVVDTNLKGTLQLSLLAASLLKKSATAGRIASIVNISSLAAVNGKEGQVPYATTKGGIIGMTRLMSRLFGRNGVRVNAVAPGFIRTEMVANLEPKMYDHVLNATALHRMGTAKEVAETVAFLLGRDAGYISGNVIRVDGGLCR